jgi:hypothetical protein
VRLIASPVVLCSACAGPARSRTKLVQDLGCALKLGGPLRTPGAAGGEGLSTSATKRARECLAMAGHTLQVAPARCKWVDDWAVLAGAYDQQCAVVLSIHGRLWQLTAWGAWRGTSVSAGSFCSGQPLSEPGGCNILCHKPKSFW